jgi:hypothetical protein
MKVEYVSIFAVILVLLSGMPLKESSRTYRDLIEGRFDVTKVIYVNRRDDGQTIFGKAAEFSRETMENLKDQGYTDAQIAFDFAITDG